MLNGAATRRVVILQPGYLPWLGFFDLMARADVFVVFDDVQYTVRDWRSRNRIKTSNGVTWLTVPVSAKGAREKLIKDVEIDNGQPWRKSHSRTIDSFYRKARWHEQILEILGPLYEQERRFLIDLDMAFILMVRDYLAIPAEIVYSSAIPSTGCKDEKLLSVCTALGATHYLSGNAARGYLREEIFAREGIPVEWHDYNHPYYSQLWTKQLGFVSYLSVVDLLFNHGPESLEILRGIKEVPKPADVSIRTADEFSNS